METKLPDTHFIVWHTLQSLEDGQKILKEDLMKRCRIEHERTFYSIIEELRNRLFFVVGSKDRKNGGYFEARDEDDVKQMLASMRKPAITQLELADKMEEEWLKRRYTEVWLSKRQIEPTWTELYREGVAERWMKN